MPTQYDMSEDDDLFRGILEYEVQPTRRERNPHYNPNHVGGRGGDPNYRKNQVWREFIDVPDGPLKTTTMCIGPYSSTRPIKSFITRNRGRYTNLRIKSVQKVASWVDTDA